VVRTLITGAEGPGFKTQLDSLCLPGNTRLSSELRKTNGGEEEEWHPQLSHTVAWYKLAL